MTFEELYAIVQSNAGTENAICSILADMIEDAEGLLIPLRNETMRCLREATLFESPSQIYESHTSEMDGFKWLETRFRSESESLFVIIRKNQPETYPSFSFYATQRKKG